MTTTTLHRLACTLDCPDTCALDVTVDGGRVTDIAGAADHPVTDGFICRKVRQFDRHVYGEARLRVPLRRVGDKGEGRFQEITWDEAFSKMVSAIRACRARWGGEAILPFCYGGSNGVLTQDTIDARLFRRLGASRLARTVCAAPTGRAAAGLYGKMPGVALEDFVHARLIIVWGANPHASGIHLVPFIRRAQQAGAKLAVVDPRRTPLAKLADLHLAVQPGTDVAVALAMVRGLFDSGWADESFLDRQTTGGDELRRRADEWTYQRAAKLAGVEAEQIERLTRLYAKSQPAVVRCGWGLERNRNGGSAVAAVLALPAVAGKFGSRGGGYTMSNSAAWKMPTDAVIGEPESGTRVVNMNHLGRGLLERNDPPIELLFVYNANPLATLPNQQLVRQGLLRHGLFSVVFDQVMTDTARYADIVLPATTFLEHEDYRRAYGSYYLAGGTAAIEPVGQSRPNYEVFLELCDRLELSRPGDLRQPRELLGAMLPADAGPATQGALAGHGFAPPPCGPKPVQFVDVFPETPDGKVHLVPESLDREAGGLYQYREPPSQDAGPLTLISPASSRTISSTLGQLIEGHVPLELHPRDAQSRGIRDGDTVRVFNSFGEVICPAVHNPDLKPGVAALPKGLWARHTKNGATANALAPDWLTDLGQGACFNDARVEVEKMAD